MTLNLTLAAAQLAGPMTKILVHFVLQPPENCKNILKINMLTKISPISRTDVLSLDAGSLGRFVLERLPSL